MQKNVPGPGFICMCHNQLSNYNLSEVKGHNLTIETYGFFVYMFYPENPRFRTKWLVWRIIPGIVKYLVTTIYKPFR